MLVVVIFGASGDLAKRKTLPALYALFLFDQLPSCFKIIGYARSELTDTDFRDRVRPFLLSAFPSTEVKANAFLQHCQYMNGEYDSAERYQILYSLIESCEETAQASKYVSTNFPENFASQRDILNDHPRNHDFSHDSMYDKKYHTDCIEAISIDVGSNFEGKHSGGNSHKNVEVKESSPNFSPDITKLNESCIQCPPNAFSNVRIYYLALPPSQFGSVASQIHKNLIPANEKCLFRHRLIVEKPFGRDSSSSSALTTVLRNLFDEQCIYRIDHYLGKEMVKSIGTIRFANHIFSSLWSRHHIKSVQIVFKETLGVEGRGGYFDTYGIIRDVMQNHLLQILSLLAMEPPANFSADAIRDAKVAVLKCIKPIDVCGSENNLVPCALSPSNEDYRTMKIDHSDRNCNPTRDSLIFSQKIVLGQYSTNDDGLLGYLEDPSVPKNSNTPTFAMCILHVENQRWKGVPFILRCGKGLDEQKAEVRIQFHPVPLDAAAYFAVDPHPNELVIRVQPRESLYVKLNVKKPGFSVTSG